MSHYKLTSTVILHLSNENEKLGEMDLSGNMTRQVEADLPVESDASHVANVGKLVEDMELRMRNLLRTFVLQFSVVHVADLTYNHQKRFTSARPRTLWASCGVSELLPVY